MRFPRYAFSPVIFICHTVCGLSVWVTSMISDAVELNGSLLSNSMSPLLNVSILPPQKE